jgi:ribosomal protein S21
MSRHFINNGKDVGKRGLAIEVKPSHNPDAQARNVENAIKNLKRRMIQEGIVKELRAREYFESKGTRSRKALQEAKRRDAKARRLAVEK